MDEHTIVGSPFNKNNLLYGQNYDEVVPKSIGPACVDGHGENVKESEGQILVAEPKEKPARPC